jgi:hypothetical protein
MQRRAFSRNEIMFLVGVPLAWAILLLFHPGGEADEIYQELHDKVTRWMVVHVGMMLFIPLMGAVVYVLLRGVDGTAALVSRIGLVVFVVFYGAFELLQGIGVGILVNEVNGLPSPERADVVQDFAEHPIGTNLGVFGSIGGLGLIVGMIAAGVALRRHASAPLSVLVLLGISGFLIGAHPPPYGPTGLALFIAAVVLFVRSESKAPASVPGTQPGPV